MRRARVFSILILVAFLSMGMTCSQNLQESWNKLTPDQKARIIINDLQNQLNKKFDEAKAFVVLNPKYEATWKNEVVPAFDVANRSLKSAIVLAQAGKISPDQVYATITPLINNVVNLLVKMGAIKS